MFSGQTTLQKERDMPANKSATIRYRIIDQCLTNRLHKYPNKEYIRKKCSEMIGDDVAVSTIEKDLQAMKHNRGLGYHAPIKYNKQDNFYYYASPEYSINQLPLNEEEWNSLRIAAGFLFQYREIPVFHHFKQAIEHINTRFALSLDMLDPFLDQYIQFEKRPANAGQKWLPQLYDCILKKQTLRFMYDNIYNSEQKQYLVDPYLLKENKGQWYLIGWNEERDAYRTYALDRMIQLEKSDNGFERKPDFNADQYFTNSVGIMVGTAEPEKVVLEIYAPFSLMVEAHPLHASQQIIEKTENQIRIELYIINSVEFQLQVLGYGEYARVIYPDTLKGVLKERIGEMGMYY